ncbi:hypothetical protein N0V82_008749 [Gnomoniopsis sp. IMI 355080]|nr:hypothetical protein N0V82_008749 [Gnomoniopsis sp. IMI 355080]
MALGVSIVTYVEISSGLGRHMQTLSPDQLHRFNASRFAAILLYVVGLTFVKLSFLAQYYRTFADRTIRRICMCFAFYCSLWGVVQAILYSFSCIPIQYLFPAISESCIRSGGIWSAIAVINVLTDAIIFGLPLKPLWRTSLVKRQKYLLSGIFFFGFVICVISVARIPTLRLTAASTDQTLTYTTTAILSLAELELAIVCTSLPVLRPIIARFVPGVSPPDPSPTPCTGRAGLSSRLWFSRDKRRGAGNFRDEFSMLDTNLSGSTNTTARSFFKSLAPTQKNNREDEHPVLVASTEARHVETGKDGQQKDEKKNSGSPKIVELNHHRKKDEENGLDVPLDFFHHPSLNKGIIKKPPAIVPRDLRKGTCRETDSSKAPTSPINFSQTDGQSSAQTTNSFRPRDVQGDDFVTSLSQPCHLGNVEAVTTRDVCSICSSELLPDRLRSPTQQQQQQQPQAELPTPLPPVDEQAKDAGTQTLLSSSSSRRKGIPAGTSAEQQQQRVSDTIRVTQSTQTALPWVVESCSPDSSRAPSLHTTQASTEEGDHHARAAVAVEVARQGTIARARERAMQAIADKTYGQVGEVHQGRARVVQVDNSQRRQAAIGLEEVLGLDLDRSPRRPLGPIQSRKEAMRLAVDAKANRPTETAAASKRVQRTERERERELTANQRQKDAASKERDAGETAPTSQASPMQVQDAGDQAEVAPSAAEKRAAATSWLRLSTDFSL